MSRIEKGTLRSLYREVSEPGFPWRYRIGVYLIAPFMWLKVLLDWRR